MRVLTSSCVASSSGVGAVSVMRMRVMRMKSMRVDSPSIIHDRRQRSHRRSSNCRIGSRLVMSFCSCKNLFSCMQDCRFLVSVRFAVRMHRVVQVRNDTPSSRRCRSTSILLALVLLAFSVPTPVRSTFVHRHVDIDGSFVLSHSVVERGSWVRS